MPSQEAISVLGWTILNAAKNASEQVTMSDWIALRIAINKTSVYEECKILRDTGFLEPFTADDGERATVRISMLGLEALRDRKEEDDDPRVNAEKV